MMKKVLKVLLFTIEAIPIPLSVLSWIGTVITIAGGIGTVNWLNFSEALGAIVMMLFFVFVGMYPLTYIASLIASLLKAKDEPGFSFWCFLPVIHILVAMIFVLCLPSR